MPVKKDTSTTIDVIEVTQDAVTFCLLGSTPFICNRMSEKAKRELLMPKGRKNATERATTLKHNPLEEFVASPYLNRDPNADMFLTTLATGFKKSMMTAALDLPGTSRAQIGRNLYVEGERIALYGVPKLFMSVTRSADIAKTPDVRTRAIVPQWAVELTVAFTTPLLRAQMVSRLLAAAGLTVGVGDWRLEKGSGNYGMFRLVAPDDPRYRAVIEHGGRAAQVAAMDAPEPYDDETAELLTWFDGEINVRKLRGVA